MQKRVLTIQDFSCLGRCSLTVAIPTISALGVECVALPTALLSNHTAFQSWTYLDLTKELLPIIDKWRSYRHDFDFIYTGYLSNEQIPTVRKIIKALRKDDTKILVDPAMADNGSLYAGFDMHHVKEMKELIKEAQYLKLNLTEACLLADIPYPGSEKEVDPAIYILIFKKLRELGPNNIVITGQEIRKGKIADIYSFGSLDYIESYVTPLYKGSFHGTGDLFASALVALLANGLFFPSAIRIAHDFLHISIKNALDDKVDGLLYGAEFEMALPKLIRLFEKAKKARS